ncbi:MAG TPA: GNAT family N-acetyltransferase, partial [Thermomicrobiales bacterium]|nr:GNAT family N-acetyltransferase [Thermomicrobiales bacterium]
GPTVSYAFGGRRAAALELRPNEALHWRAIHDARRAGYRFYDFGEVPEGHQGLAEFKRKWGATPQRLYRYYSPAPPRAGAEEPEGRVRRWAYAAWRYMPLACTALMGDWLYGYL